MGLEIERKFLVDHNLLMAAKPHAGVPYRQGYLYAGTDKAIRVRIAGEQAFLTVKGATKGASRSEYEYVIPFADAVEMLEQLCGAVISKVRYIMMHDGNAWELDVFEGNNEGLVVAELELPGEDFPFTLPGWVTREVTDDERYYNAYLARHPFREWAQHS